jgi:hypothetical protein
VAVVLVAYPLRLLVVLVVQVVVVITALLGLVPQDKASAVEVTVELPLVVVVELVLLVSMVLLELVV